MSIRFAHSGKLVARGTSGRDAYNNPVRVDAEPVDVRCNFWQESTRDENAESSIVRSEAKVLLPAGTTVAKGWAFIDHTGRRWEIDGEPDPQFNGRTGQTHHVLCDLRRGQ